MRSPFTFLQIADVHLDSKLPLDNLPKAHRQRRNREILNCLWQAFALVRKRNLDAVIIAGDLFDNDSVTGETVGRVIEACKDIAPTPVIIAPGNRDYFCAESLYNSRVIATRGIPSWPPNVHIFQSPDFTTFAHPLRDDISFTGRAFTDPAPIKERLLKEHLPKNEDAACNILVFHGALDGYFGGDAGWHDKVTAPFSESELRAQGFAYAALGHYHDYTEVRSESGMLLGAYSGSLGGRSFDELGPRYAIVGTIESARAGRLRCSAEQIEFDRRRMLMVGADITGLSADDMMDEINLAIEDQAGRPDDDIVYLHLEGRYQAASSPADLIEKLQERFPNLVVQDNTRPDYLAEKYDTRTTEWKFIEALLALKKEAEEKESVKGGSLSSGAVEDALYYGLDALKQKRVTVRDVD